MIFTAIHKAGTLTVLAMLFAGHTHLQAQFSGGAPPVSSAFSIPTAQQIQPEELNRLLHARGVQKPLMLQVGSRMLFAQAHIPGSEYVGAGSQAAGLQQLQSRVGPLARNTFIVIYCGCCPWNRCPNLGPAFKLLHDMGFTRVKVLHLADNLGTDWVNKGYPVEASH